LDQDNISLKAILESGKSRKAPSNIPVVNESREID